MDSPSVCARPADLGIGRTIKRTHPEACMLNLLVLGLIGFAAVGILLITSVQQRIIRRYGMRHFQERRLLDIYWYDRTIGERWYFWIGLVLLLLPFVALGVWRIVVFLANL